MKNNENILRTRTFNPKLTNHDTVAFAFLAAEKGLTPEQLIESFVSDIVSSFSADMISEEEKHLADWFNGSWFSQDNDGYFTFLQYVICNKFYKSVAAALKMCNHKEAVRALFKIYCTYNPAHKSFAEEIRIIREFDNNINEIARSRKNKWR